jgi:hypothetical protein
MNIPASASNHPFALIPIHIPEGVVGLEPTGIADVGIPHFIYDKRPEGLLCVIDPLTELREGAGVMEAFDEVTLYVDDVLAPNASHTILPGKERERFGIYLIHGLLKEGVNKLHYRVTRVSGNANDSNPMKVLYHLRAPGAPAPLNMDLVIPPDVITNGVDADRAALGVAFGFTYSNRRAYDRIDFVMGNFTDPFEVPNDLLPVTRTLGTVEFTQAGDNPNTELVFTVWDQLNNFTRSSPKYLNIHLGEDTSRPPLIIDTATMVLDGTEVFVPASSPWTQTDGHGPGNRRSRTPTSGTPPYRYLSANSQIATVGSADGVVTGQRNGQTLVTVTDATGQVACYQVQVSNKWDIEARSDYAHGQTLWGWSAAQMPPVEPRPSFVSGLREAIIRRLPDPSEYCHPVWGPDLEVITYGRVSGHAAWPADDGEVAVHFYNSDGSIGLTTRPASKIRAAAGWGFRPRDMPQSLLGADTSEIYSALVEASARTVDNMGVKKEQG